jgi:hypothetical protein
MQKSISERSKVILIAIIAIGSLLFMVWFIFTLLFPCTNEIKSEVESPDHQLKAVIFSRDCGATTDVSMQVSVISKNDTLPNEAGNVFIEDSGHGAARTMLVSAKWTGPRELLISHDPKARIFKSKLQMEVPAGFSKQEKLRISYTNSE